MGETTIVGHVGMAKVVSGSLPSSAALLLWRWGWGQEAPKKFRTR